MLTPAPGHPAGGNRITQAVLGAHDGGVFGLCALRDGTLVSGGGRDRRVVLWGSDYSKLQEVEVRRGRGSYKGEEISHHPTRAPNTRPCSPSLSPPSPPCPHLCCCCSVTKLHPTLCDPMDCSTPGLPVPSLSLSICPSSCPLNRWCYPAISNPTSTCVLNSSAHPHTHTQVPEDFGPVRTVAEGRGDTLYVGTTRNSILQGSVHTGFSLLVQVSISSARALLHPDLPVYSPLYHSLLSYHSRFSSPPSPIPYPLSWLTPLTFLLPAFDL